MASSVTIIADLNNESNFRINNPVYILNTSIRSDFGEYIDCEFGCRERQWGNRWLTAVTGALLSILTSITNSEGITSRHGGKWPVKRTWASHEVRVSHRVGVEHCDVLTFNRQRISSDRFERASSRQAPLTDARPVVSRPSSRRCWRYIIGSWPTPSHGRASLLASPTDWSTWWCHSETHRCVGCIVECDDLELSFLVGDEKDQWRRLPVESSFELLDFLLDEMTHGYG